MRTTDNNCGVSVQEEQIDDLLSMANCRILDLCNQNPDLLVFPHSFEENKDGIEKELIFSLRDQTLTTYNMMGFVGKNSTKITITSRFSKDEKRDYFLHYMLQKVLAINLFNFDQSSDKEYIWDFLLYLFPYYLKKAFSQGLYKAYRRFNYNDANIKGRIDINRHIKENIPFKGTIAYNTKEYSLDNSVMQLIRHTIEYIRHRPIGQGVLYADTLTKNCVKQIEFITRNSYNPRLRSKIIFENLKPLHHPYFNEYYALQQICLQILRREQLIFGSEQDKIYGVLFDGAWLWEEYLNTILKPTFYHPENKSGKYKNYLFANNKGDKIQAIYPDFISKTDDPKIVADAKYINLSNIGNLSEGSERATSIYYKTITYMYRWNTKHGALFYPSKSTTPEISSLHIIETDAYLHKIALSIPQEANSFQEWVNLMIQNEAIFLNSLDNINHFSFQTK